MPGTGIVGFSFALRSPLQEPNPCNVRLADEVLRIARRHKISAAVTQWEITKALKARGVDPTRSVELTDGGDYLDSAGVWREARDLFVSMDITEVIVVAQPFLQLGVVKRMIKDDGFTVINEPVRVIGFDSSVENTQWWTRNRLFLLLYGVMIKLGFEHGHGGRQTAGT